MNIRAFITAVAALAMTMPSVSQAADDDLSYARLTHCAAFTMLMGQVMGMGENKDKPEYKAAAAQYQEQSIALLIVAIAVSKKDAKVVTEDVNAQNTALKNSLSKEGAADRMIKEDLTPCTELGKAAAKAVKDASTK